MPYFKNNETQLYYELSPSLPSSSKETILFLTGITVDHTFWNPVVSFFSEQFNLILLDNPGSGKSSLSSNASTRQMAQDAAKLISSLNINKINVVGHGIGGMIGQWIAIDHPSLVSSLFLYSTSARPRDAQPMVFNGELFSQGLFELAIKNILLWSYSHGFCNNIEKMSNALQALKSSPLPRLEGIQQQLQAYENHDSLLSLANITIPSFIIAGERDRISMLEEAQELNRNITNSNLVTFKNMANMTHVEMPEEFSSYIITSIQQIEMKNADKNTLNTKRKLDPETNVQDLDQPPTKKLKKAILDHKTSLEEFDNNYWEIEVLQEFAQTIGVQEVNKLAKNDLQDKIKLFLKTGKQIDNKPQLASLNNFLNLQAEALKSHYSTGNFFTQDKDTLSLITKDKEEPKKQI